MFKVLIIYPNWLPSNAVGVQRIRLICNYLHKLNWKPILVCVKPEYYEEEQSEELLKLVSLTFKVEKVDAIPANPKIRIIGDIALRAFRQLYKKAIEVANREKPDFIWTPIPPFYTALITRLVSRKTKIPYAIDYIDPWVHPFPGSNIWFSRAWFSLWSSLILEPIALRKVSVISGVAEEYYLPAIRRNKNLGNVIHVAMPYGFDANDYSLTPQNPKLIWDSYINVLPYVYAGAFLPKSYFFLDKFFEIISLCKKNGEWNKNVKLFFIGTSGSSKKPVTELAIKHHVTDIVIEKPERISYLEVLNHLKKAKGVLAIGSTEKHYTASKIFQSLLSGNPVFPIFHNESTVIEILKECNATNYMVEFSENTTEDQFKAELKQQLESFLNLQEGWSPNLDKLDNYSSFYSAKILTGAFENYLKK